MSHSHWDERQLREIEDNQRVYVGQDGTMLDNITSALLGDIQKLYHNGREHRGLYHAGLTYKGRFLD